MPGRQIFCALVALCLAFQSRAATISSADVTATLGPTFFVDEAATGGSDLTVTQPSVGSYARNFSGQITTNQGPTKLSFTGFGFASLNDASKNTATSLSVSITYLGADAAQGGGDDVFIGTSTGTYLFTSNAEYSFKFDVPLSATLNITGVRFLIQIAPSNAGGNGSVSFKTASLAYEGTTGPKFSVAGTATKQHVNLAKYQVATASTENGQYDAVFGNDGVVGNNNRWSSTNVNTTHWLEVDFPFAVTIRSTHCYMGSNDSLTVSNFKIQSYSGGSWVDAPGSSVLGNTAVERNIIFSSSVTSDRFRFYTDDNSFQCVKEFALFPPNPNPTNGVEQGFPIGTDVELDLAKERPVVATSFSGANYPKPMGNLGHAIARS